MDTQTRHALKQDSFVQATSTGLGWLEQNRQTVIKAAVAIVLVVAVVLAGVLYYNNRSARAQVAFGQAMIVYDAPLQQPGAPADPNEKTYATAADRARAANPLFLQVADKYSWFKAGTNARYFAGLTYQAMGRTADAESSLKKVADSHDAGLAALAKLALANLEHQQGNDQAAIEIYKGLIANPAATVSASAARLQLAAIYEVKNPEEAKKLYAEIKDKDKDSAAVQIASQKLSGK